MRESSGRCIHNGVISEFPIWISPDLIRYQLWGVEMWTSMDHIFRGHWNFEDHVFEYMIPVSTSAGERNFRFKVWYIKDWPYVQYELYDGDDLLFADDWIEGGKIQAYNQDFYFKCCATCKWGGMFSVSAEGYFCFERTPEDRGLLLNSPKYPYTWEVRDSRPSLLATHQCNQFELRPGHPALSEASQE